MSAPLDRLLERLEGVRKFNGGYMARCPHHDDRSASLSICEGEDGRVLLYCQTGTCKTADVVADLGLTMADLFPEKLSGDGKLREIVASYDYVDEAGELLYQVVRYAPKTFRQRRSDGNGGFVWSLGDTRRVLYRLPAVVAGVKAGATIWVVEGERDVEALEAAGCVATTNSGGAGKWRPEYSQVLAGAKVIIVADNDGPGRNHAAQVAASLRNVAVSVCVVEARQGKDAADHLAAGFGPEEFVHVELADAAAEAADDDEGPGDDTGTQLVHEAAHAEVLKGAWCDQYRWSADEGTWRHWNGRVWERADEAVVVAAAQKVLHRHYGLALADKQSEAEYERLRALHNASCRYTSVAHALAFLKGESGFYTDDKEWDRDLDTLNCADGLLDLNTQTPRPHDPSALCTMITRWSYSDESTTGAWERQLQLGLPNPNIRRQVQRDLGRALSGGVKEHSLPIWYGSGRNTKTTDAEALLTGLGEYAAMAVGNLLMASKNERHPTEIAELSGKRLVFSDEIDDGKQLAEARVKDLTGGGGVKRAHFMHADNFDVKKTFTIFLLVNHLPTISGTDKGIWDRIREVPWAVSIPFAEQRKQDEVVAELVADGSWMLRWMVAGYADFQAEPRWIAEEVRGATDAYHAEQDRILGFITDVCEEKPFVQEAKEKLYDAYLSWCANEEEPLSKTDFGKALKARQIKDKRVGHDKTRVWVGIRLHAGD